MKASLSLLSCICVLAMSAATVTARDANRSGRVIMKALSDEEIVDPLLGGGEMLDLLTAAQVDTYCIVWYDFEVMSWQGWTRFDNTAQRGVFFHVDDFDGIGGGDRGGLVPLEGTKSMWCGVRPGGNEYLCSWAAAPGYGNNWDQSLDTWTVSFTGPLTLSYKIHVDTEPGYDRIVVQRDQCCGYFEDLAVYEGIFDTTAEHTMYLPYASTKLRFHFSSDGAWSDEDGLWNTDGAAILDSITLRDANGIISYEDFESAAVGTTRTSTWWGEAETGFGLYSGLMNNLPGEDGDPCNANLGTQIVFFIGSPNPSDEFPGLYDTPYCAGSLYGIDPPCQDELIVSPVIDMTRYSGMCDENQDADIPPAELPDLGGVLLRFNVFDYLPISNLVFYDWYIRNIDPSGCPGQWVGRNIWIYYTPMGYILQTQDISDLVESDSIQVALQVIDMCDVWYQVYGDCADHTPAPWFDDVRIQRYGACGPRWSYRQLDLFQDNFPDDMWDLESCVRADMANDLRPNDDPVIDPGDSVVVTCTSPMGGGIDTTPDGRPKVFMHVKCTYIGDPGSPKPDLYGPALEGTYGSYYGDDGSTWTVIQGEYARTGAGNISPDRYAFDLNDSLITRGYRIDYYFEAYDLSGESSTLPKPKWGGQDSLTECFEWTCLPTLASDILYVDDYNRGSTLEGTAQIYWDKTFRDVLPLPPDRYDVNSPTSLVSNGPGSRAEFYHLAVAYRTIIWDSGNLEVGTISDGTSYSDKSDDCSLLLTWLGDSEHNVGLWLCGDGVASDLDGSPDPGAYDLLHYACGVQLGSDSYFALTGGAAGGVVNPKVRAYPNPQNPLWHTTWGDSFYAFGGCPLINDFDVLDTWGVGEYALRYPDHDGLPRYAGIYAVDVNGLGYLARTMTFGFSFMYIRDCGNGDPIMRNIIANDVLSWMENDTREDWIPDGITGADEIPLVTSLSQNFPNPFNPVTTIKFALKEKGHVSLKIYDIAGRLVKTLVNEVRRAGYHEERWDGTNNRGANVASGVYFYRFRAGGFEDTKKTVLLR